MGRPRKKDSDLPPRMHRKGRNFVYTPYVNGKLEWHNLGPDKATALFKWAELEGGETSNKTVGDALRAYVESDEFSELAERTQDEYRRYIQYHLMKVFGSTLLADVQPSHISQYVHKKGYVGNRHRSVLSNAYQLANLRGWSEINPTSPYQKIVHKAKEPRRIKEVFLEDVLKIREVAIPEMQRAMDIAWRTGLRKSDLLLRLLWENLSDTHLRVEVGKTRRALKFVLDTPLREVIESCPRRSEFILTNSDGTPFTVSGFDSTWRRTRGRSGVEDFEFNDLRRFAAQETVRISRDESQAQKILDHTHTNTTRIYLAGMAREVQPLG